MKKVNIELPNQAWGSIKTKYPNSSDLVGFDELTNDSKNFDTTVEGIITKRPGGINYNATTFANPPSDQYEAIFNDGVRHLLEVDGGNLRYSSGGGTFTDVTSGYSATGNFEFAMNQDRVYFGNGIDNSQVYDRTTSYGGVGYTAPKTKDMGAQAPSSAPSAALNTGGSVPTVAHTYKVTFLYYDLEESNGGPATGTITPTAGNQTVDLSSLPIGGYGVTARKIYRDDNDGVYLLVGTVANNTATTFSDTASTGTAPIPTDHDTPPAFQYIVAHLDRNWIAGIPGDPFAIMFSEAGLPNVFPASNRIVCNQSDPVTGLYVYNDKVWVFNRNTIGSILGTTKDTFRYSILPSSVGCVDNRTIQIRTTSGIPVMLWLSSRGIYGTNGSSVTYLSDAIEDLVNFNIQQASQVKGQNAQTTQSQFLGGTASPGIDLTSSPGIITTPNPIRTWDDETDWEGGSSLTNIVTNDGTNTISAVTKMTPEFSDGSNANTVEISSTLRTPVSTDFTGSSRSVFARGPISSNSAQTGANVVAFKFRPTRSGTLTSFTANYVREFNNEPINFLVYGDLAGSPNGQLANFGSQPSGGPRTWTGSVSLTGGVTYWFQLECDLSTETGAVQRFFAEVDINLTQYDSTTTNGALARRQGSFDPGPYTAASYVSQNFTPFGSVAGSYTFVSSPVATSGIWTGPIIDSFSDSAVSASINHTGTFPSGTSSITTVEASNSSDMSTPSSQTFNNLNGSSATSLSNFRYWRIKIQLSTTDDRNTAQIGIPTLKFATTATWISEAIDHTTDITTLDALTAVTTVPAGTSATVTIATSADDITYSPYTAIGSATPARYSKVKVDITTTAANDDTAVVTNVQLKWTVVATFQSSAIDTGSTPAGWDIFQAQSAANGGTLAFSFRSAASLGALTAATYVTVTSGQFPTTPVEQYAQWRVIITSTANMVPTVDSVTINWFISNVASIRAASIFYNRAYYLAAAEYNETSNNVVIVLDGEGNWRLYRGINANTLGYFFNEPYYGSSSEGRFIKFLQSTTDQGTPIEMIVDTKSVEFDDPEHTKILRKLYLRGHNTGAVYQVQYSFDGGETFYSMIDETTGLTSFTTTTDGLSFYRRFIPDFTLGNPTAGKQILFRIKESTEAEVSFEGLKAEVWIRAGELV